MSTREVRLATSSDRGGARDDPLPAPARRRSSSRGRPAGATGSAVSGVEDAPLSVLVVDDHRAFGEALALAIASESNVDVRTVRSSGEAVRAVEREGIGVVFLDLGPQGFEGIDSIRRLRETRPTLRVIAVSQHDDDLVWARAVEAGAVGYVSRRTSARHLPEMARAAARGDVLIERDEQARLLRVLRRQRHQESTERQRANRLTPRQVEILQLTADGASSREIAVRLGMSQLTLRSGRQNILTRLGVHSKCEALTVAIRHGKVRAGTSRGRAGTPAGAQRVSRCSVWCVHQRQYFDSSSRSRSFSRFLPVV